MSATILLVVALIAFLFAFKYYGTFLANKFELNDSNPTPAHTMSDGVDYVPAKAPVLLGHHFASIAGAAPIIGPVAAAVFGWIPAFLWIVLGGIFFGAVHDFSSLVASVRHKGKSIGAVIETTIGIKGKLLFTIFAWLTVVLIMAAFINVVANTFVAVPQAGTASLLFIVIAVVYGFLVFRNNFPVVISTIAGIALLVVAIGVGLSFPLVLAKTTWIVILLGYIVVASVTPVWILLQPRDYLNSFLLYALLGLAIIGLFFYNPSINAPAFVFSTNLGWMFPILFVTIACGAISGFHSLVSSGTTAKQLNKETDAKVIGYGGMLIESTLSVIALITAIMVLDYGAELANGGAVAVFSRGVGGFLEAIGVPLTLGVTFASLVVSAFALTTLDTATRLGRYIFQELFEKASTTEGESEGESKGIGTNMYVSTIVTVGLAGWLALTNWATIWPIFGSANQLLAALALLAVSVWLVKLGKDNWFVRYPMYFMFAVTLFSLVILSYKNFMAANFVLAIIAVVLFVLAIILALFAYKTLKEASSDPPNSGISA